MFETLRKSFTLLAVFAALCCGSVLNAGEEPLAKSSLGQSSKMTNQQSNCGAPKCDPCSPPRCPCKPEIPCCLMYPGEELCPGELGCAYNAPASTVLTCAWDFSVTASFIYWEPRQDEFYLAQRAQTTQATIMPRFVSYIDFDYKYKPGFKVGLGVALPIDSWSLSAEYTWLHGSETSSATAADPEHLEAWFAAGFNGGNARSVTNNWKFKFDIVDLSLARPFYSGTRLILTPFVGGRLFFNHQKLNATNTFDTDIAPGVESHFTIPLKVKANAWELGPRIGIKGDWLAGAGFGFMGDLGLSMLYASFKGHHAEFGTITGPSTDTGFTLTKNVNFFAPNLDLSVGARWGSYVNGNREHVELAVKYDFLYFWKGGYISQLSLLQGTGNFDLYLQGLTVSGSVDF